MARVRSEVVGQDDVVGGIDGVFKPPKLGDRTGDRKTRDVRGYGLVATLALDANKFAGRGVDRGFAGVGARFDRGSERESEVAQRVGRGDLRDADARAQIRAVHQKVIADFWIIGDARGERGRKIDRNDAQILGRVGDHGAERTDRHPIVDLAVADGWGGGRTGKGRADFNRLELADRDRHLAIQVFLHQPGGGGGRIDLLVFVHHPQAHHDN